MILGDETWLRPRIRNKVFAMNPIPPRKRHNAANNLKNLGVSEPILVKFFPNPLAGSCYFFWFSLLLLFTFVSSQWLIPLRSPLVAFPVTVVQDADFALP